MSRKKKSKQNKDSPFVRPLTLENLTEHDKIVLCELKSQYNRYQKELFHLQQQIVRVNELIATEFTSATPDAREFVIRYLLR